VLVASWLVFGAARGCDGHIICTLHDMFQRSIKWCIFLQRKSWIFEVGSKITTS